MNNNNEKVSKYNVIKFQAPFEKIKNFSDSPEVRLYRAIILQAIIDASNISSAKSQEKIIKEAKDWIFKSNSHFITVCEQANLLPEYVKNIAYRTIELNFNKKCSKIPFLNVKT